MKYYLASFIPEFVWTFYFSLLNKFFYDIKSDKINASKKLLEDFDDL